MKLIAFVVPAVLAVLMTALPAFSQLSPEPKKQVHILRLKTVEADSVADTLKQMYRDEIAVTAYAKTNRIVIYGTPEQIEQAEKLVAQLDQKEEPDAGMEPGPMSKNGMEGMAGSDGGYSRLSWMPDSPTNLANLKQLSAVADQRSMELAAKYREELKRRKADDPRLKQLHNQLQEAVTAAFQLRQNLHRAEIAELEQKIKKMKDLVAGRDRIRLEIINRRVADLENPARVWEEGKEKPLSLPIIEPNQTTHFLRDGTLHVAIEGTVLEVVETPAVGPELVNISVGSRDGVKPNTIFAVKRDNTIIGQIQVFQVANDRSMARVLGRAGGQKVKVGDRIKKLSTDPMGSFFGPVTKAEPPSQQGTILAVAGQIVELSLGADNGIKLNTVLHVWRGNVSLGEVEVILVQPDRSIASVHGSESEPKPEIQKGDQVGTDPPDDPMAPGKETSAAAFAEKPSMQLNFKKPDTATLVWTTENGAPSQVVILPARIDVPKSDVILFQIDNLAGHPNQTLFGSFTNEVASPAAELFTKHNAVPVEFTNEDIDQVLAGNLLIKVFYLPKPEKDATQLQVEVLVSTRLDPRLDPLQEAEKRGDVLGALILGNRQSKIGENEDWHQRFVGNSLKAIEAERDQVKEDLLVCEEALLEQSDLTEKTRAQITEKIAMLKNQLAALELRRELYQKELSEHDEKNGVESRNGNQPNAEKGLSSKR